MSRLLRGRVRRLEERAAGGNVGRTISETLEEARRRARRGEHVEPLEPWPSESWEELAPEAAAGGWRGDLAAAKLRVLDLPGAAP